MVADITDSVRQEARDAGDAAMNRDKEQLKGLGGFFKKIWKHNLFHEVYRQKEIAQARQQILETGNIYTAKGGDEAASDAAKDEIVERFASEFEEEMVHLEAGEEKRVLGATESEGNTESEAGLKTNILDLMKSFVRGEIDEADFDDEKRRLFNKLYGRDENAATSLYTDNLKKVAENIKANISHYGGLENLDLDMNVVRGVAKSGARTEAKYSKVDQIVESLHKTSFGRFVNEATLAAGVALTQSLLTRVLTGTASRAISYIGFGAGALLSSGLAAAREGHRLEDERRQVARESAEGSTPSDKKDAPRRNEMEKYLYNMRGANDLRGDLESALYDDTGALKVTTPDEAKTVLAQVAEIHARISVSDKDKVDLISFSNAREVEKERRALDETRAKAIVALTKAGFDTIDGKPIRDYMKSQSEVWANTFTGAERKDRDKAFGAMKQKQCAKRAVQALLVGGAFGLVAQELGALGKDNEHGLLEDHKGEPHQTALAALFKRVGIGGGR